MTILSGPMLRVTTEKRDALADFSDDAANDLLFLSEIIESDCELTRLTVV